MEKRIFTFWEPQKNMPGYIQLCLKTWKQFLPDYEIIVCDYSNLKTYLTRKEIHGFLCKKLPLAQQADALRAILLKKYGGIWLDADTIITSSFIFNKFLKNTPCAIISNDKALYLAFIYAQKEAKFIEKWGAAVQKKITFYRRFQYLLFLKKLFKTKRRELKNWDYLGNSIVDPLRFSLPNHELLSIDKNQIGAFPELIYETSNISAKEKYKSFYFSQNKTLPDDILEKTKGIILLHNSWTPSEFKKMSQEEFLKQDIPLAHLLKTILEIKQQ